MTQITKIVEATITVAPPSEIEKTRHQMYTDLKRFQTMVGSTHLFKTFQDSLEAHLEELRKANCGLVEGFAQQHADIGVRLANMTEERDQIQQRLHAIDHAYNEQSNRVSIMDKMIDNLQVANKAAGEELIRVQGIARQHLDDCRSAEKLSDELDEKLRDAQAVIGHQGQLITGQRLAIAELYMAKKQINIMAAGGRGVGSVHSGAAIFSNGAGYPGSGAGAVSHGVGAGGSGSGGGAGRAGANRKCNNQAHHQHCQCGQL